MVASLAGRDISAIEAAIELLNEQGFQVPDVDTVERDDDGGVEWTMTVTKDTRSANLAEYEADGEADD